MADKDYARVPLPPTLRELLKHNTHAGLELDKYAATLLPEGDSKWQEVVQKPTLEQAVRLSQAPPPKLNWTALCDRRATMLRALGADLLLWRTTGPFTLHLSRASALENAGICLHPLYGFVYLPGSGLKGMARAYAETVWLPTQSNPADAWRLIEDVFGWAPGSDREKSWKPGGIPERTRDDKAHVGNIIFHDAWPTEWPRLIVDIVNNHHPAYYQARPDDSSFPPGDWENPNPVYFLAVPPGTGFQFALSPRRSDVGKEHLERAREWLVGGLSHLGAGAKTAAGYGSFQPEKEPVPTLPSASRAPFDGTLELVTPAFLAGAQQQEKDCVLRAATLRGVLRWWWRTMHAGHVDVQTLRALEAAIWGDTRCGGAVRIEMQAVKAIPPIPVPGKIIQKDRNNRDVLRPDPAFIKQNGLKQPDFKSTQGVLYLTFGMDEMPAGKPQERKQRYCIQPGAQWRIVGTARDGFYRAPGARPETPAQVIGANLVREQAQMALWLLCQYGGIGSKAHNSFGSFADIEGYTLERVQQRARDLRKECRIEETVPSSPTSPALATILGPLHISTPWKNVWFVLDQLGFSIQDFAKDRKRTWVKEALGLPRKVGISQGDGQKDCGYSQTFDKQTNQQVVWLGQKHPYRGKRDAKDMRHASPAHFHLFREVGGTYGIRAIIFPSPVLAHGDKGKTLAALLEHLKNNLAQRIQKNPAPGQPASTSGDGSMLSGAGSSVSRTSSASVRVKFLGPHEKQAGFFWVQEEGKKRGLLRYGTPRSPLPGEGEEIEVYATNNDPRSPQYRWDPPPKSTQNNRDRGRPGGGRPPRGGR